ncbi:protein of unknown function [Pararobbsia alpina]
MQKLFTDSVSAMLRVDHNVFHDRKGLISVHHIKAERYQRGGNDLAVHVANEKTGTRIMKNCLDSTAVYSHVRITNQLPIERADCRCVIGSRIPNCQSGVIVRHR